MVKYPSTLDSTFAALADPTRRAILSSLSLGTPVSVSELARPHRMSLPAVVKHLHVLERAGLVSQTKVGRVRQCSLSAGPMKQAADWLTQYRAFWDQQFDALERYFARQPSPEPTPCPPEPPRRKRRSK